MKKKDRKKLPLLLGGSLALAAATGAAYVYGVTDYTLRVAMDREMPASRALISWLQNPKKEEKEDPYAAFAEAQERLRLTPHFIARITSRDGIALVGHWFPREKAKRVILAVHGWRSSWYRDFSGAAGFWAEEDCSVLYIEQRGQGDSGGTCMAFGTLERLDCLDWLDWLVQNTPEELPIYLAGISMGATTVLLCADLDLPARVKGIMADCGFTSADEIFREVARKSVPVPYPLARVAINRIFARKTGWRADALRTTDALAKAKVPVLLFHGEADRFVPVWMSRANFEACTSEKDLMTVPGAIHGLSFVVAGEAYKEKERAFWRAHDGDGAKDAANAASEEGV
ncbi:MAG: alpha/beta fold hydrolase [Firmicutes bacterium]|nr:alpha/beta fold hydrolase [Bacillota bacterium]